MANLQLKQISLAYGDRDILKNITLNLSSKSRIALSGANGCGKSTLLKILAGEKKADKGDIILQKDSLLGYLPQSGLTYKGKSLQEEAETAFEALAALEVENDRLGKKLQSQDLSEIQKELHLQQLHENQEKLLHQGYYERESKMEQVLLGLGFKRQDFTKESSTFSGGWQMRIALAKVLLLSPDFLLMDEPTNYLDLEARLWLSDYLQTYTGGILIVSHDRYFLDSLIHQVAEIFLGELKIYKANYTRYQQLREQELDQIQTAWKAQQIEIEKIEDFIRRFRYKDSKAAQVQSRVKMLEKMEKIEIPENLRKVSLEFPDPPHSGKEVMRIRNLCKNYGDHQVLKNLDLDLEKGDKWVISGVNGAGKSTLMRILSGEDKDFNGELKLGSGVKVGYFAQEQDEVLNPENTLLEELESCAETKDFPKLRSMAGSFLFSGDDVYKKVSFLSGGEKNRLALLKMLLKPFNLLIMDEPTNHLDIHSKDILLEALKRYPGTLLFVSHDRSFIEGLAEKVLELKPGSHKVYYGDYSYYMWKKQQEAEGMSEDLQQKLMQTTADSSKESRQEEKENKAARRRLERKESELLEQIQELEQEIERAQEALSLEENYSDPEKARLLSKKVQECEENIHLLSEEWERVSEELQQYL